MRLFSACKATAMIGVAVAAVGWSASPAQAATTAHLAFAANLTSTTNAGYALSPAPATASAATTFKVPGLKCPASGISGVAPAALIFTGSGATASISGAGVFIVCQNGATIYQAETIVNGSGVALAVTVAKGDVIAATVSVSATKVSVTFKDTTKHFSKTATGSGAVPSEVLDGIDSLVSAGTQLAVPNFGTIAYSASKIDGKTLKAAAAKAVDMVSTTHVLKIKTGVLGATGNSFTETFHHA